MFVKSRSQFVCLFVCFFKIAVKPTPKSSPKSPSPKRATASSDDVVPAPSSSVVTAPTRSPNSGTYSTSASLVLILSMLYASFYCVSF